VTERVADTGLSLPTSSVMSLDEIDRVVDVLCDARRA
jgi:dTDP-4-amino-4,6-dideoxygalactose transaminase